MSINAPMGFAQAVEQAFRNLRDRTEYLLRGATLAGALTVAGAPLAASCLQDVGLDQDPGSTQRSAVVSATITDWAQERGVRSRTQVRYDGHYWHNQVQGECYTRFCQTFQEFFIQLLVRPEAGVNLDDKKVGISYRLRGAAKPQNALGYYVTTRPDGWEEWHVPVRLNSWESGAFSFSAWYETGSWKYNEEANEWRKRTFYDDNAGDLYPVVMQNNEALAQSVVPAQVAVGPDGVQGSVSIRVLNLDYEKQIEMVWTTDSWATVHRFGMGEAGTPNEFYYVGPFGAPDPSSGVADYDEWRIDLDVPGPVDTFEYALAYSHGLATEARRFEFWDNNHGENYRLFAPLDGGPIAVGQEVPGTISRGRVVDYELQLEQPQQVQLDLISPDFDCFLEVWQEGVLLFQDDDSAGDLDSRIVQELAAGTYRVRASALGGYGEGAYSLVVTAPPNQPEEPAS